MSHEETIAKYMTVKLITFSPDRDIKEATQTLLNNNISGAPVVNEKGDLIGILSERDCIKLILDGEYNQRPSGLGTVREFMSTDVKTLDISTTVKEAAYKFVNTPYRRFPVTNNGRLAGQVSRRDILKAIDADKPKKTMIPSSWKARKPQL